MRKSHSDSSDEDSRKVGWLGQHTQQSSDTSEKVHDGANLFISSRRVKISIRPTSCSTTINFALG